MNTFRTVCFMAWADFLERVRRYSFLIMLGMVVWLGYFIATGGQVMSVPPNYVGETNSAWVGALMTITVALFLGLFGFYLVKGSVSRDYETGVGQIIATTPLSRSQYALGKWLSNFAVLSVMILIMIAAGIAMNLLVSKASLELWKLISPLLFIGLPWMALVAALAVLFEMIGWLRGGLGNIAYFFLFTVLIAPAIAKQTPPLLDFTGISLIGNRILQAASLAYPTIEGGFSFNLASSISAPQRFLYNGIDWTASILLQRFFFLIVAVVLVSLASVFFDRFNSSMSGKKGKMHNKTSSQQSELHLDNIEIAPSRQVILTPLQNNRRSRIGGIYMLV